ncbi:C1q-like domain-containing protein [Rhodococcus ruber]|uniref:C1q-like domain-containing protein n=1 Tax=Rhodococcus ruber TaxID=1830 RepID=UPI001F3385A1|nr:hypothetical protein [Rhodococcus ruber]MCF8783186.1 hypothetical protein [Rhodococcus ruber]
MFDNFKIANYSNSLVSPELYARHFSRLITGNVIDGLTLVPKTGLTVTLQPGNALIAYGSGATASARMVSLVADFDITLSTADASNPRIDSIVCYVDTTVSLPGGTPTSANLDGPGVWKAVKVNGTPNASPVAPNSTAIQAAIGAGKPYFVAHDVRVDAGVTTIASNKITDRRTLATVGLATALAALVPTGGQSTRTLTNPYKFSAYRNAALSSAATDTVIQFDTKKFDTNNNFDVTTNKGRYTVPVDGYYWFTACAGNTAATSTSMRTCLLVNGTIKKVGNMSAPTTPNNRHTVSGLLPLTAGQYVEASFIGGGGSVIAVGEAECYFEGFLVSAT